MATAQAVHQGSVQVVVFDLAGEHYGADIAVVQEVRELQKITPVPRTPAYILGVTNLRGGVIPVIDLRRRLGLPSSPPTKATRIAVAETDSGGTIGMIVDAVTEVITIRHADIEAPSPVLTTSVDAGYISGVARVPSGIVILLDLARVLAREERQVMEGGRVRGV